MAKIYIEKITNFLSKFGYNLGTEEITLRDEEEEVE